MVAESPQPATHDLLAERLARAPLDAVLAVPTVADATAHVRAAIEVVDSRIADWKNALFDTIADNASSAAFVLGDRITLDEVDLADVAVAMVRGRSRGTDGNTSAVLGDPQLAGAAA